jgi:hypothetical protein
MPFARVAAGFVLSAGLLGFAQAQQSQSGPTAACSLITKEDATAALGESAKPVEARTLPNGPSSCEFSGSGINMVRLSLIPLSAAEGTMYKALCAQKSKDGLTGLGDTTCWYNDKHQELQVLKGTTFFTIEMRRSGDPTEPIKALARKIYERMK